jgi:hypothetical protein
MPLVEHVLCRYFGENCEFSRDVILYLDKYSSMELHFYVLNHIRGRNCCKINCVTIAECNRIGVWLCSCTDLELLSGVTVRM